MTQEQISTNLALVKHIITFLAGAGTSFGLLTIADSQGLITDFDHIANGIKEIMVGVGPLVALGVGLWSRHNATTVAKVAAVAAAEPAALVTAVQAVSPVTLRDAVAAQPEVIRVLVDSKAVADASPSPKVVLPGN